MTDPMDAAQDLQLLEIERLQARRLAALNVPVPDVRRHAVCCADCGQPIDPRRVRALPACQRCTNCQAAAERRAAR